MIDKKCTKCGIEKPSSLFYKDKSRKDGLSCWCKACACRAKPNKIPPKEPTKKRVCKHCGICFESMLGGNSNKNSGSYCSIYCSGLARTARKIPRSSNVYFTNCKWCGKLFTRRGAAQVCSGQCRLEMNRAKSKAFSIAKKGTKTSLCKECGESFISIYGTKRRDFCSEKCMHKNIKRISRSVRRARKRGVESERVDPYAVFKRDMYKCKLCGRKTIKSKRGTTHQLAPEIDHIIPLAVGGKHNYANTQCSCRQCNIRKGAKPEGQLRLF